MVRLGSAVTWTYDAIDAWWWPYAFILLGAAIPTQMWKWLGVVAAGRLTEDMPIFHYVRAVATALVAAVIAQLIVFPTGVLAEVPLWLRLAAGASGFVAMELADRRGWVGILVGETVLMGGFALLRMAGVG